MADVTFLDVLASTTQIRAGRGASGRARRSVLVGVVALGVLTTTGCLPETKTTEGRALHKAPDQMEKATSLTLSLKVSSLLVRRGALTSLPAKDGGLELTGVLDLRADRASYALAGRTVAVFDHKHAYARRPNALPTDARPWVHVVVNDKLQDRLLDPVALPASLLAYAFRPTLLVDALSGALTGSIVKEGTDEVDGTATQRYRMRVDLTQAFSESTRRTYSQREQDDLAAFLKILGIKDDDLHGGEAWIDSSGMARRIVVVLDEHPADKAHLLVRFDLTLTPQDTPAAIDVPKQSAVATVPQLFQYLQPLAPKVLA